MIMYDKVDSFMHWVDDKQCDRIVECSKDLSGIAEELSALLMVD